MGAALSSVPQLRHLSRSVIEDNLLLELPFKHTDNVHAIPNCMAEMWVPSPASPGTVDRVCVLFKAFHTSREEAALIAGPRIHALSTDTLDGTYIWALVPGANSSTPCFVAARLGSSRLELGAKHYDILTDLADERGLDKFQLYVSGELEKEGDDVRVNCMSGTYQTLRDKHSKGPVNEAMGPKGELCDPLFPLFVAAMRYIAREAGQPADKDVRLHMLSTSVEMPRRDASDSVRSAKLWEDRIANVIYLPDISLDMVTRFSLLPSAAGKISVVNNCGAWSREILRQKWDEEYEYNLQDFLSMGDKPDEAREDAVRKATRIAGERPADEDDVPVPTPFPKWLSAYTQRMRNAAGSGAAGAGAGGAGAGAGSAGAGAGVGAGASGGWAGAAAGGAAPGLPNMGQGEAPAFFAFCTWVACGKYVPELPPPFAQAEAFSFFSG